MKQHMVILKTIKYAVVFVVLGCLNTHFPFIPLPKTSNAEDIYSVFITVSTVFAGFSFTALGLLLGLSSETLIQKIKNTSIMIDKVRRIVYSIVCFMVSAILSLIEVLKITDNIILNISNLESSLDHVINHIQNVLYMLNIGFLICGIFYFSIAVYDLYHLLKRIYSYNSAESKARISAVREALERNKRILEDLDNDNDD
ncbi:MAG: hypothetical protein MR896_03090 [Clostridiales bacterium]|nr:hypothetical protein [Clostridiales bacterium]